jgi:hypothetical protein
MITAARTLLWLFVVGISATAVAAGDTHDDHHHHHPQAAHVHGEAKLTLALEGNQLQIEFTSPAMNIVGFERKPANQEQQKRIEQALAVLKQGGNFLVLQGGDCRYVRASSTTTFNHNNPFDAHNDQADNHKSNQHSHHGHAETHQDFSASYVVNCRSPKSLTGITVQWLSIFQDIKKIEVQWVIDNRQGANTLTARQNRLTF